MVHEILLWATVLIPSAIIGILCGYFIKGKPGIILAGVIPWLTLLAIILYKEYAMPYQSGGASMWPIVQLTAGTIAAITGIATCIASRKYRKKKRYRKEADSPVNATNSASTTYPLHQKQRCRTGKIRNGYEQSETSTKPQSS